MISVLRPLALAVSLLGLASCYAPPPPPPPPMMPPPGPAYMAPMPPPPMAPRYVGRCGPGKHWVRGHYARGHRWIPAHCAWNRR